MPSNCLNFKMFSFVGKSRLGSELLFASPRVRCLTYGCIRNFIRNQDASSFGVQ